jgi:hypothetical protein
MGRKRRGPPWPLGRLKRPVPNIRGGGPPVPNGLADWPGEDLDSQDPFADPNANYGMPPQEQMARGGVVTKPTVAVVGERGPEAVVKFRPRMNYQRRE